MEPKCEIVMGYKKTILIVIQTDKKKYKEYDKNRVKLKRREKSFHVIRFSV